MEPYGTNKQAGEDVEGKPNSTLVHWAGMRWEVDSHRGPEHALGLHIHHDTLNQKPQRMYQSTEHVSTVSRTLEASDGSLLLPLSTLYLPDMLFSWLLEFSLLLRTLKVHMSSSVCLRGFCVSGTRRKHNKWPFPHVQWKASNRDELTVGQSVGLRRRQTRQSLCVITCLTNFNFLS